MISVVRIWSRLCAGAICCFIALVCALPGLTQALAPEKQQEVGALTKLIAANGNDYALYAKRGFIYLHGNQKKEAEIDFEKALRLNPKWQQGYLLRAEVFEDRNDFSTALLCYEQAETVGPLSSSAIALRGNCSWRLKKYESAIADFTKAIRLKPDDRACYACRANARLEFSGPSLEVVNDLEKCVALDPTDSINKTLLADVKARMLKQHQSSGH